MDVLYVYCFKSVGSYKHKLSRIESLVILYWGINCSSVGRVSTFGAGGRVFDSRKRTIPKV